MASDYLWFEGIPFPQVEYRIENLRSVRDEFVVRDEDVITLSYPKSGTHWVIEIISMIHSKGDSSWVQSVPNWDRSPWIESTAGYERLKNQKGPRLFTSHLPIQLFPKSFFNSKAKAIYINRNPRDVITSGFYYWRTIKHVRNPDTFEQFFEWFLQGNEAELYEQGISIGRRLINNLRYADNTTFLAESEDDLKHLLDMPYLFNVGYNMNIFRRPSFYLPQLVSKTFELHSGGETVGRQDIRASVEKISQFLGKKLGPEEFDSVLKNVSFEVMKNNKMSNFSLAPDSFVDHSKGKLMRKGVVGDWKHHFTVAQSETFDKIYKEKMAGLPQGLFPWES